MRNPAHRDAGFMILNTNITGHGKTAPADNGSGLKMRARSGKGPVRNSYVLSPEKATGANRSQLSETHHGRPAF